MSQPDQSSAAELPSGQALPAGTRLEEFVVERVLGSGGFGITYLAKDARLGRQVVIKENLPVQFCFRDPSTSTVRPRQTQGEDVENFKWSLENFEKEATMLASLDHPGIVRVLRSFEANGTAYFAMPFIEGTALDQQIHHRQQNRNAFTEEELSGLLWRMLDALDYLHSRGIYHRDIKPGNILITHEGIPVLIDFGSARQRLSERSLTVMESAGYTPFEQLQTRGKIGPWSDLYALGATLYKAITGETPPKANDRAFDDPMVPLAQRSKLLERLSKKMLESVDRAMVPRIESRLKEADEWRELIWGVGTVSERSVQTSVAEDLSNVSPEVDQMRPFFSELAKSEETVSLRAKKLWVANGYNKNTRRLISPDEMDKEIKDHPELLVWNEASQKWISATTAHSNEIWVMNGGDGNSRRKVSRDRLESETALHPDLRVWSPPNQTWLPASKLPPAGFDSRIGVVGTNLLPHETRSSGIRQVAPFLVSFGIGIAAGLFLLFLLFLYIFSI